MPRSNEGMFSNKKGNTSDTRFLYLKRDEKLEDGLERLTKRGWGWSPMDTAVARGRITFIPLNELKREGKGTPTLPRVVQEGQTLSLEGDP